MKILKKVFIAGAITMVALIVTPKIMPGMQVNATSKSYKLTQFKNEKFYKIKDVAKKKMEFSKVKTSKKIKYDLDKDNKKDTIKVKKANEYEYIVYVNGKKVEQVASEATLYIVDLNKNDKSVNIVIGSLFDGASEFLGIYQKKGDKVKQISVIASMESPKNVLINKKGKIVTRDLPFMGISPYVTNQYYNLSKKGKIKTKKLSIKKISKKYLKCKYDFDYVKNKKDVKKYFKGLNTKYVKTLKSNTKFKIVSFENGWNIKIKLKNGETGYLVPVY